MRRSLILVLLVTAATSVALTPTAAADTTHVFLRQFTLDGNPQPFGTDSEGNIYVYRESNNTIGKYSPNGLPVNFSALGENTIDGIGGSNCPSVPSDCDAVPSNGFSQNSEPYRYYKNMAAVDKPLVGLAAVQTLSRLNRIHPLKESTFVLDFRNETEEIVEAFEQFHGATVAPPTDPNILWDTRRLLDNFDVLRPEEIEAALPALLGAGASDEKRSAAAYAALGPAKARFEQMGDGERLEFRDARTRFVRTYSFVSQIAAFTDPALEGDYVFCRALSSYLRDTGTVERLDLGSEVELTHLRHQMIFSGSLELTTEAGEVRSFFGEGKGGQQEIDLEHLSSIVEVLNERFGTDLTDVDRLLLDQFEEDWVADGELSEQARNNSIENFGLVFNRKFLQTIVSRVDSNEEIFKKILDDEDFRATVGEFYLHKVYERLREAP